MTKNTMPEDDGDQATHIAGLMGVVDVILGMNDIRKELSRLGMPKIGIDVVMGTILSILTTSTHDGEHTKTKETLA